MARTATPLFSKAELTAAYALLLPRDAAENMADRWFEQVADSCDSEGRALYEGAWGAERASVVLISKEKSDLPLNNDLFQDWRDEDAERWLIRLGELQLALVALVNDDCFERMRQLRGMTPAGADRNRQQLLQSLRAHSRRRDRGAEN